MAEGPKELQGVEAQPGTGVEGGVPAPEPAPPAEGQPPVAVPTEPPTAPPTAARVNLDELDEFRRWKSESDRRYWETEQRRLEAEKQAEDWRLKAETADMDDESKLRFLTEHYQQRLSAMEQQQQEFQNLIQWQYWIADQAGVNPSNLNPMEGVQGMMKRAFETQGGKQAPTTPRPATPTPQPTTPKAPSAPTSTAPTSGFQEWASGPTWEERQKKIPKGKAFEAWMEELGESE